MGEYAVIALPVCLSGNRSGGFSFVPTQAHLKKSSAQRQGMSYKTCISDTLQFLSWWLWDPNIFFPDFPSKQVVIHAKDEKSVFSKKMLERCREAHLSPSIL